VKIFRSRSPLAIAAAAVLALSACESDSTGSELAPEGSAVFTYAGDAQGSFNAVGRFNRERPGSGTFAVGSRGEFDQGGGEGLVVLAHVPRPNSVGIADEFLLSIEEPAVGQRTCVAEEIESCTFGSFLFLGARANGDTEEIYASVSGTLTITSLNEDRAAGTFSFEMETITFEGEEASTVQITSGTFDVPLVSNVN
jgi:hypothetical protein